ncbi:DUF192 domain-containing protein [Sphingomonas sp. HITSZ_GF]|uniref:DUF192 domain-containing protein n=1 Tax=Sphingomonas sp. HITSZ_GF TaxID=3037247 RepID=UPI00240E791C|nr:DUF192 domain-containing protein [Sphingomonas sp. HITSZ_GF]MDG2533832.1 DUF192 domain-containing protein [Sphingomonas sp. HITSZ_GF]
MTFVRGLGAVLAASGLLVSGVSRGEPLGAPVAAQGVRKTDVTIDSAGGQHVFHAELARTAAEQERGLMFRTNIPQDGGMLFAPYPADGPPREARFWMKNTPTALDILFIRGDGTIARIAENAVPYSEETLVSGEPVAAVLEVNAGVSARLGIKAGDKVRWAKQ